MSSSYIPAGEMDGASTVNNRGDYSRGSPGADDAVEKKNGYSNGESAAASPPVYKVPSNVVDVQDAKPKKPFFTRVAHSFRRRETNVKLNSLGQQIPIEDAEKGLPGEPVGPVSHDTSRLSRKLQGRHLQMIAIGGSIGTGLFIGSGSALATGGPAALIICFGIIGVMLFCVIHALGELAVLFPIAGIFLTFRS
jgi:Amino acid permease